MDIYLDNIIYSLQKMGGISIYWNELAQRLISEPRVKTHFLGYKSNAANVFSQLYKDETIIPARFSLPLLVDRYMDVGIVKQSANNQTAIFHSSYYRLPRQKQQFKIVTTVHDFTYERYFSGFGCMMHKWQKRRAIQHSDVVICVSKSTKEDLLYFYPEFERKDIRVVYNGVSDDYHVLKGVSQKLDTMLYVGSRAHYKNFIPLIKLISQIPEYKLLIVGSPLNTEESKALEQWLPGRYSIVIHPSNAALNLLYNSVFCLFYPSSYEGFGIPVVEAMKAGCAVITLSNSSLPEVCGSAGVMMPQLTLECFQEAIVKVRANRDSIVEEGRKHASQFSWENCYKETFEIYKQLA